MRKKGSWVCTLVAQVSLCIALYFAFNLGQPGRSIYQKRSGTGRPLDVYFISVRGGYRNFEQQTHLLKLMEKVAKIYKASFVVNISEMGKDDPLTQNATRLFPSLNIPWYTTRASKGGKVDYSHEQINMTRGKMLNIVGLDTGSLRDLMLTGSSTSIFKNNQLNWLTQALEASTSNWVIVVGYDTVLVCEENKEQMKAKQTYGPLHHIFVKYGVNVYLSKQGCTNHTLQSGVTYIGIPDPIGSGPYLASLYGRSAFQKEMANGFLLHRVSSLEITTYFVTSAGIAVSKNVIQRGKEVM